MESMYAAFGNNPILNFDILGDTTYPTPGGGTINLVTKDVKKFDGTVQQLQGTTKTVQPATGTVKSFPSGKETFAATFGRVSGNFLGFYNVANLNQSFDSYIADLREKVSQELDFEDRISDFERAGLWDRNISDAQANKNVINLGLILLSSSPTGASSAPNAIEEGEGGLNLYKSGKPTTTTASGWQTGDRMLHLVDKGSPKLNWLQNAGRLRQEMNYGKPIYDSYRYVNGAQIPSSGFINAERYLLESRGWQYNPGTGAYHPPF
jgi:hypothetical protein